MTAALGDDLHVDQQRIRYARRRKVLSGALTKRGFRIEYSEASLYLWATRGESCWDGVHELAEAGILVSPGEFYGPAGSSHVRVTFTATDEEVEAVAERLDA